MVSKIIINPKEPIVICDIGASSIDTTTSIDDLMNNTNSILYGFEPNEDEFSKLNQTEKKKYFNIAIGNGCNENLNICAAPGMSSMLKPDLQYLNLFNGFAEWAKINKSINIKTQKLDEINFEKKIDFFKIDVQGYEYEIIKHGEKKLKDSLIIQIETSPCFKPMTVQNNIYTGIKHLFQLDCVFIKNLNLIDNLNVDELKKLALILFYSFKSYDLVDLLLQKISKIESNDYNAQYRDLMKTIKINKNY